MEEISKNQVRVRARVKICGITRTEDGVMAALLGADAVGLNFCRASARFVTEHQARAVVAALPAFVQAVGVFVDAPLAEIRAIADRVGLGAIQLHGEETPAMVAQLAPCPVVKAFRWRGDDTILEINHFIRECSALGTMPVGILVDSFRPGLAGGTGASWTWREARKLAIPLPLILAGGLHPQNVAAAIEALHPYGVDVAGGVENAPGIKDSQKMADFMRAAANVGTRFSQ